MLNEIMELEQNLWHRHISPCVLTLQAVNDFCVGANEGKFSVDSFNLLQEQNSICDRHVVLVIGNLDRDHAPFAAHTLSSGSLTSWLTFIGYPRLSGHPIALPARKSADCLRY
jgi:hypothetical protein